MKRNHPPDERERADEKRIIEERLKEIYCSSAKRKVLLSNKGVWSVEHRHVVLESGVNAHQFEGMVVRSASLAYSYLEPYQALYLLESSQILIYHNGLPLSLVEAYKVLLISKQDLLNYSVFSHLNRTGYFCYKSVFKGKRPHNDREKAKQGETKVPHNEFYGPLFELDNTRADYQEISDELQKLGPQLISEQAITETKYEFTFDIYKRETYNKNKPRRGKNIGRPDHHVIVCDKMLLRTIPGANELNSLRAEDSGEIKFSGSVLFALVDADSSLSFVLFEDIPAKNLALERKILPYTYKEGMRDDYRDVFE